MPPRFLERMQTQAEMQNKWHRDPHSGPPSYQHLASLVPSQDPPTYRKAVRSGPPPPAYREHQYSHAASMIDLHSFPDRSTLLVIGAYTRQGMHIIDQLLDHHYRVRGVVSNAREASQAAKHFEARHGRENYTSCIVSDMAAVGAFDIPAKTCSGVVFVASSGSSVTSIKAGTLAKVRSALGSSTREANMHRFVFCSPGLESKDAVDGAVHPLIRAAQETNTQQHACTYESDIDTPRDCSEGNDLSIEAAIWDWIQLYQPGFALDLLSLPSNFGSFSDSFTF